VSLNIILPPWVHSQKSVSCPCPVERDARFIVENRAPSSEGEIAFSWAMTALKSAARFPFRFRLNEQERSRRRKPSSFSGCRLSSLEGRAQKFERFVVRFNGTGTGDDPCRQARRETSRIVETARLRRARLQPPGRVMQTARTQFFEQQELAKSCRSRSYATASTAPRRFRSTSIARTS